MVTEYPVDFRNRIGFDTVLEDIFQRIQTVGGGEILQNIRFRTSASEVIHEVGITSEMLWLIRSVEGSDFPKSGYVDFAELVQKMRVEGGYIESVEMLRLASGVELCESVLNFFRVEGRDELYPLLCGESRRVVGAIDVAREVRRIVDKFGEVKDSASEQLATIRRDINRKEAQISKRLGQILQQAKDEGYAHSDSSLSVRDGRAVIPVSAGHKRKIKGFVFDESATGRTAYIEPLEVIELNNEVRELQSAQRYEIVRILMAFAEFVRPRIEELLDVNGYVCQLDFLLAKAKYAHEIGGAKPLINSSSMVSLIEARHPLLQKVFRGEGRESELVPLSITLSGEKPLLLISGPNAGGKSVCLKTVGLLQYMFQCGILPSVSELSEMGVFDSIFLDIGDQQSIDNDLSTYSSHLTNMKVILREATQSSLVLIDEFGGGTEPGVGGAIAESILTCFTQQRLYGVITTHYANLKYYAAGHSGIENGAMTFDVQRIKPLYSLEMGVAGNSYAFEIARKIGLPEVVLRSAESIVGADKMSLEKQLREANRDKRYWENKRQNIRLASKSVESLAQEYERELLELQGERKRLIKEAKAEASRIVKEAGSLIESTIREIKEAEAEKEQTKVVRRRLDSFKAEVSSGVVVDEVIERKIAQLRAKEERRARRSKERSERQVMEQSSVKVVKPKVVEVGSLVRLDGVGSVGEVLSIRGGKATVAFGTLSTVVELGRLALSAGQKSKVIKRGGSGVRSAASVALERAVEFSQQLDVRGMRAQEAFEAVQQFIDSAIMVGSRKVRILHGKGTGALKEEVRRYLKSEPAVSRAYDENVEFGGAGITVVEF